MRRIRYFDVLRVVCFCFIIFYHMIVILQTNAILTSPYVTGLYSNANLHIATLAVAVFFMLSGASLMVSGKKEKEFDIKKFYKKRLLRLLVPFYLTYAIFFAAVKVVGFHMFEPDTPKWRFLFTLFGIDGWMSIYGIDTFYLSIGEWFLGCIIVLYLLFPLLRWLLIKYKVPFLIAATVVYFIVSLTYDQNSLVPVHESIVIKGYEFILGMVLGTDWEKINRKWAGITIPLLLVFLLCPVEIPLNPAVKITVIALAFFMTFSFLEPFFKGKNLKVINTFSSYSYDVFLVHHFIMSGFAQVFASYAVTPLRIAVLCLAELAVIVVFAVFIHWSTDWIMQFISKKPGFVKRQEKL